MRHDVHYVESLGQPQATPVGRMIALDKLDPNPDQPRADMGDLAELTDSIRDKGVLEPLLVRYAPLTGRWMIIAGERRFRASTAAGLLEVPCIELNVDDQGVAEIALIENMQRKDLTPWEEADGLLALCNRFGYTHEEVAQKIGKSRSTVTEALSLSTIPLEIREACRAASISSKSHLLQIVRQPDEAGMRAIIDEIANRGLTRDGAREARKSQNQPASKAAVVAPYVWEYKGSEGRFRVEVRFAEGEVKKGVIAQALDEARAKLHEE
jgi:ParB family chromosome partitioning protein